MNVSVAVSPLDSVLLLLAIEMVGGVVSAATVLMVKSIWLLASLPSAFAFRAAAAAEVIFDQ